MTSWSDALGDLASATRARAGQIAALDRTRGLFVNLLSGTTPDEERDYLAAGGADPTLNPRTHAAITGKAFRCAVDDDFTSVAMRRTLPIYTGLFTRNEIPHSCIVPLGSTPDNSHMAMALLRPGRSGVATRDERMLLEQIAPAIAATVSASLTFGTTLDTSLVRTAETLSGPAILIGVDRKLISVSPAAEAILRAGTHLTVRAGRLVACGAVADAEFDRGFRAATGVAASGSVAVALRPSPGVAPMLVDCCPLPVRIAGPVSAARALVSIRAPRRSKDPVALLKAAYALTRAEAEVALALVEAHDIADIARHRDAAIGTVRNQVKALFDKTGTRRQAELVLALKPFC